MNGKLNIGVIGLGIGRYHVARYLQCPTANIVAVADQDGELARRIAGENNIPFVYKDYKKLLEREDINAVSVCLPNFLHALVTIQALESGKHVLCEKPMARTSDEAEQMIKVANKTGRKLMVGMSYRFRKDIQFLRKLIQEGELGEIYYAHVSWLRRQGMPVVDFPPDADMGRGTWFIKKNEAGGGVLMDVGVHMLDLVWWVMGNPKISAVCGFTSDRIGKRRVSEFSVDDFTAAFIRVDKSAYISLEVSWVANTEQKHSIELLGTRGGAKLPPLTIYTVKHNEPVDIIPQIDPGDMYLGEINNFLDAILEDKPMMSPPEDELEIMKALEAIYASAEKGKEISLI